MNKGRKTIIIGIGLLLVVFGLGWWVSRDDSSQIAARSKLDQLLGQSGSMEEWPSQGEDEAGGAMPGLGSQEPQSFFGLPLPASQVDVQENSYAYVLRVPLVTASDASKVQTNVTSHHVEVSGQTGSQSDGTMVSSSFMQSFSTNQEVLPDQVTRQLQTKDGQAMLVITIPKKSAGETNLPADEVPRPEAVPGLTSPRPGDPDAMPTPPANPLDGIENKRVI